MYKHTNEKFSYIGFRVARPSVKMFDPVYGLVGTIKKPANKYFIGNSKLDALTEQVG